MARKGARMNIKKSAILIKLCIFPEIFPTLVPMEEWFAPPRVITLKWCVPSIQNDVLSRKYRTRNSLSYRSSDFPSPIIH